MGTTPTITTFAAGLNGPNGMAFLPSGVLLVTNANANTISQVSQSGVVSPFASGGGLNVPYGNAVAPVVAVPEPGTLALASVGIAPLVGIVRRRRNRAVK